MIKLTDQFFERLKKIQNIPKNIFNLLNRLRNTEYKNKKEFTNALKQTIGEKETETYKTLIFGQVEETKGKWPEPIKWIASLILTAIILALLRGSWRLITLKPLKIYLIGDIEDDLIGEVTLPDPNILKKNDSQVARAFMKRQKELYGELLEIKGVRVEIIVKTDKGDPLSAESISRELAKADNTLMIVGHMSSTQTKKAIANYLQENPPIPIILTKETNPDLISPHILSNQYRPVFRLSATDEMQAQKAVNHFVSLMDERELIFWVVEDSTNPIYSNYLALEFIKKVQEKRKSVLLYSSILSIPSVETFSTLGVNCVFFAGGSDHGLILVRQIRRLAPRNTVSPITVLSDACVKQHLINQGGQHVEGVYLTYPLRASQLYNEEGYRWYGKVAYDVVEGLVKCADKKFYSIIRNKLGRHAVWLRKVLGTHNIGDARLVINTIMEDIVTGGYGIPCNEEKYFFNREGVLRRAKINILQVRNGRFCDIDTNNINAN